MAVVWTLQKLYLRTSRQIRLLDLEAKSPLYSNIMETFEGLHTIRAFGWQQAFLKKNWVLLDSSQQPFYLLYCIQRWLNLVLDLLVAAMAVVLMTMAIELSSLSSGGGLGAALVTVLTFNKKLAQLIDTVSVLGSL